MSIKSIKLNVAIQSLLELAHDVEFTELGEGTLESASAWTVQEFTTPHRSPWLHGAAENVTTWGKA